MGKKELELPVRIRQSSLTDARCLYHYQQHHIKGVRKGDSEASVRGTHFHAAAKEYVDHLVETGQFTHYAKAEEIAKAYPDTQSLINRWCERSIFYPEQIYATEFNILLNWDFQPVPPDTPIKYSPYSGTLETTRRTVLSLMWTPSRSITTLGCSPRCSRT